MTTFKDLYAFIDKAIKSRKYPENTGQALKAALGLFEDELKEEESNSLELFKKNLGEIYRSICSKNHTHTAGSLATYKSRILRVIDDYEKYGVDPTLMANWTPKTRNRRKSNQIQTQTNLQNEERLQEENEKNFSSVDIKNKYSFIDSGEGWQLSIKSKRPITTKMKKVLIEVFEDFEAKDEEKII